MTSKAPSLVVPQTAPDLIAAPFSPVFFVDLNDQRQNKGHAPKEVLIPKGLDKGKKF